MKTAQDRPEWITRISGLFAVLIAGCISAPVAAQRSQGQEVLRSESLKVEGSSLWTFGLGLSTHFDPSIPTPESILGHPIGDGAVRYAPLVRYLHALADASPRVTLTPYGETHEGRTLYYLTITSQANHSRLQRIQADAAKLADPRKLDDGEEANRLIDSMPGIAWLAYSIHGDELSSTDAAVQVAYTLAAATEGPARKLLDELVIHIDPLMNPDGRERYLSQLQQLTGKVPNSDYQAMQHRGLWSAGRGNHYLFDLNRDWVMQVHPETRGRAAAILKWNPHLVVDSHEMGSLDTYLFDPPREPFNNNLSLGNLAWRRRFSADQAKAFDQHGWSYYTREWYEEWYPGYTNAWANLLGAVGILYEQAGVNAAAVKQPTGHMLTYREAVHHHFVSSFANLETLRWNRRELLRDYLEDRKWAVSADRSGHEALLVPPPADQALFSRFMDVLRRNGIEFAFAAESFTASGLRSVAGRLSDSRSFADGTLIVRAAQPHRRLLRAILEFDPHVSNTFLAEERKELENHRGSRMYDVTAWNVCMAFGLEAYWADRIADAAVHQDFAKDPIVPGAKSGYGYLIDGADSRIYPGIVRLFEENCRVRIAAKSFGILGRDYEPGAVLLRNHENPAELPAILKQLTEKLGLDVRSVDTGLSEMGPDLGGQQFRLLEPPRIAIASQWPVSTTSFGATWHLLDARIRLPVSPFNLQAIGRMDLRRYNVIVLPHTRGSGALGAILNEKVRKNLRAWIESGGTLVALGSAAAFVASKDHGLSAVRLKRDILDQLKAYEEAVQRERRARDIDIDLDLVWANTPYDEAARQTESQSPPTEPGSQSPPNEPGSQSPPNEPELQSPSRRLQPARSPEYDGRLREHQAKPDKDELARLDAWQRIFRPQGAIVAALLDPEHWLCFGVAGSQPQPRMLPVLLNGPYALMSRHPVRTPVRLASADRLRLSGLIWPEARERWAQTAYATVERVGRGQIILFPNDPFFRGYFEGSGRLLLNALILGPGFGASQPIPW